MRRFCWMLLPAALALVPTETLAQDVLSGPYGYGYTRGGVLSSRPRSVSRLSIRLGLLNVYGLGPARPLYWAPSGAVRIYAFAPAPPPIIVIAPSRFDAPPPRMPPADPVVPSVSGAEVVPLPMPEKPRILPPPEKERPAPPVPPRKEEPKEPPKKEAPKPVPPRPPEGELPRPPAPADDPREEQARLVERGKEAFKDLEYGRAAQRFRQAVRLAPDEALPHFLLAQALLAGGKYHEAYDAILKGLRRRPDWPAAKFRPLELYGEAVGEYPEQLTALEATLGRHPGDPVLLFLYAYQLWFDGRKDEAAPVFRRALARGADRDAVDRFLRALPAAEL